MVSEYEADALALDLDDEKRLERAERMAERKVAAKKRKSDDVEKARKEDGVEAPLAAKPTLSRPAGPVVCYGCGEAGHFKRDCPKKPSVVYPLVVKDSVGGGHVGIQAQGECGGHGKCMSADLVMVRSYHLMCCKLMGCHLMCCIGLSCHPRCGMAGSCLLTCSNTVSCMQRCWECEEADRAMSDGLIVKGRLRQHVKYWVEELHATQWIIERWIHVAILCRATNAQWFRTRTSC